MAGSRGLESKITSPVVVNRILERLPDYNPKGEGGVHFRGAFSPPFVDFPPRVKCDFLRCPSPTVDTKRIKVHAFLAKLWTRRVAWKRRAVKMFGLRVKRADFVEFSHHVFHLIYFFFSFFYISMISGG